MCPEGFPGCPIPCPVCPLERSWVFPAAQHPWGTGRCCDTHWVSHWRLRFGGHRWGTPTPTLSSGAWGTWGPEGAGLGVQEGAGSAPTARLCPGSGGHRAALASLHSARIGPRPPARCPDRETIPSGSPHCSHLTFTATVTTLSRLCPIFHSLLPLIQSLCPFKLFFSPPIHFPDASILFSCLAPLLSSCYANKHEAEKGASLCRAGEERKTPEPSKC